VYEFGREKKLLEQEKLYALRLLSSLVITVERARDSAPESAIKIISVVA